jgi:uncharacterized protein YbjT (DUF2867 family)
MSKKAIVIGASGLIGSNLLQLLLDGNNYTEVLIFVRKKMPVKHAKLKQVVTDLGLLDNHADEINGHALFSCLGTTLKQTPDKVMYRKIDHDYPVRLAQLGKQNGVKQYLIVSAVGADAASSNSYLKLKGETDEDLIKVGLPGLHIFRPSMLRGRTEKVRWDERMLNAVMAAVDPFLFGGLKKFHSIAAADVANAMYNQSIDNETGTFIYQYDDIIKNK